MKRIANMLGVLAVLLLLVLPLAVSAEEVCNHNSWAPMPVKNATCTEPGTVEGVWCSVCHFILDPPTETAPAAGHDWAEEYTTDTEPTCTEAGSKSIHCSRCDAVKDTETIPVSEHIGETVPGKEPTCTETGLTDGSKCAVCEAIVTEQKVIPVIEHSWTPIPDKEPTCTQPGSRGGSWCMDCHEIFVDPLILPAAGHSFAPVDEQTQKCGGCGAIVEAPAEDAVVDFGTCGEAANWYLTDTGKMVISGTGTVAADGLTNKSATTLVVKNSITGISESAFRDFNSLQSMTLPFVGKSRNAAGYYGILGFVFGDTDSPPEGYVCQHFCSWDRAFCPIPASLNSVTITDAAEISYGAFWGMGQLSSLQLNEGITVLDDMAFYECSGLTELTIPNTVTKICNQAFSKCTGLTELTIPENVGSLEDTLFNECTSLKNVTFLGNAPKATDWRGTPFSYYSGQVSYHCEKEGWKEFRENDKNVKQWNPIHPEDSIITVEAVAPTCTETGLTAGEKCSVCDEIVTAQEVVSAKGHTLGNTLHEAVPHTCTEDGTVAYYDCYNCDAKLSPARVELESIIDRAPGEHRYYSLSDGTCNRYCEACDYHDVRHNPYEHVEAKAATCTEPGNVEYWICSVCKVMLDKDNNELEEKDICLKELGHDFNTFPQTTYPTCYEDGEQRYPCAHKGCDEIDIRVWKTSGHIFEKYELDGDQTCTDDGHMTAVCYRSACSVTDTRPATGAALGHLWGEYTLNGDQTCTEDGTKTASCTRDGCSETNTVEATGEKLGHLWGEYTLNGDQTCTEDGTKTASCTRDGCSETNTVEATGAKLGHAWGEYKSDNDATCTEDGHKTASCTRDGCSAQDRVVAEGTATGHTPGAEATETEPQKCTVCGEVLVPALGHKCADKAAAVAVKPATGSADGTKAHYKCSCGMLYEDKACTKEITADQLVISKVKSVTIASASYTYDGKVKNPAVTVKDEGGKTLVKGTDYTVTYSKGRKDVGSYTVTIKGKGNYSFTKTLTFKINPVKTAIAKLTARSKAFTVKWSKKTTQVTGYQIQYSLEKDFSSAKTVTVKGNTTVSKTIKKLKGGKTYYVRIRTYKTVGKTKFYSAWSAAKSVKTKK